MQENQEEVTLFIDQLQNAVDIETLKILAWRFLTKFPFLETIKSSHVQENNPSDSLNFNLKQMEIFILM